MSIYETLRQDSLLARKTSDKFTAGLLVTLMSEIQATGKTTEERDKPSDEVAISVIKKFVKNAQLTAEANKNSRAGEYAALREIEILETYLPKQLTEDEIKSIIDSLKSDDAADMKTIMSFFKVHYSGQYDGALVAKYAR